MVQDSFYLPLYIWLQGQSKEVTGFEVHVHMCTRLCFQRTTLDVVPQLLSTWLFLRHSLLLSLSPAWNLLSRLNWLSGKPQGSTCLYLPSAGNIIMPPPLDLFLRVNHSPGWPQTLCVTEDDPELFFKTSIYLFICVCVCARARVCWGLLMLWSACSSQRLTCGSHFFPFV